MAKIAYKLALASLFFYAHVERRREAGASLGVIDLHQGEWDGAFALADVADAAAVERAFDALAPATATLRVTLNTTGRQPARGGGTPHVGITAGPGRAAP